MGYKAKNNVFTIILFILLAFVVYFAIWKLAYDNLLFNPIRESSASAGLTYSDVTGEYTSVINNKYEASTVSPNLLKFDGYVQVAEKSGAFYKATGGSQIILTLKVYPKLGGSFKYEITFDEIVSISAATRNTKGTVTFDPSTYDIISDTTDGSYFDTYEIRIKNLVNAASEIWGSNITED